jgi:hypothetical protein
MAITRFNWILARHRPYPFDTDDSNRTMVTGNYEAQGYRTDDASLSPIWEQSIAALISTAGLGSLGTAVFIGPAATIPAGNGPFISIINTGGPAPRETHNGDFHDRLSCQILVRASTHSAAYDRALAIYRAIGKLHDVTVTT